MSRKAGAYFIDSRGIRNKHSGTHDYNHPGPLTPGQPGYVLQAQEGTHAFWIPFQMSHDSMNSVNEFSAYRSADPSRGQLLGLPARTDPARNQCGNIVISVAGKMERNVHGTGGTNAATTAMIIPSMLESPAGFPMMPFSLDARTLDPHDYNLKALYEYGNAQYQFASDAMPTRVLPNLVPVRSAPGIPDL